MPHGLAAVPHLAQREPSGSVIGEVGNLPHEWRKLKHYPIALSIAYVKQQVEDEESL